MLVFHWGTNIYGYDSVCNALNMSLQSFKVYTKTFQMHSFPENVVIDWAEESAVTINDNTIKYETSVQDAHQVVKLFTKKIPTTIFTCGEYF